MCSPLCRYCTVNTVPHMPFCVCMSDSVLILCNIFVKLEHLILFNNFDNVPQLHLLQDKHNLMVHRQFMSRCSHAASTPCYLQLTMNVTWHEGYDRFLWRKLQTWALEGDVADARTIVLEGEALSDPASGADATLLTGSLFGNDLPIGIGEGHRERVVAPLVTPLMKWFWGLEKVGWVVKIWIYFYIRGRSMTFKQRWHRYYPKFPELYSCRFNS